MGRARIDVVYVNYNATDLLLDSVDSLLWHAADQLGAVIVVDNDSRPDQVESLRRLPKTVTVIRADRNLGFARASNLGARYGHAGSVLFLNPDTVVGSDTIGGLLAILDGHGGNVLVGPRHYADAGRVLSISPLRGTALAGKLANALWSRGWLGSARLLRARLEAFDAGGPTPVRALSGAALAIGRRAFEALGGFDERYFLYVEDTDLCVRARAAGYPVLYLPDVGVVHFGEQSAQGERALVDAASRAGREAFYHKHHHRLTRALVSLATRAAQRLPMRQRRWTARVADPAAPFALPAAAEGRRVFELARTPMFDNGLSAFPDGLDFCIPQAFLARLGGGTYYGRLVVGRAAGRWREVDVFRFTIAEPEASRPERNQRLQA